MEVLMTISADLHIHTCLSPCGSLEMSPNAIAAQAKQLGFDLIAVTDHNSAMNCPAFAAACERHGIACLFGIEATSVEEVHILCLFETAEAALDMGSYLYGYLPDMRTIPEKLGDQVWVDEHDSILGEVERYLGNALSLTIGEIKEAVFGRSGLFIPAHIDKPVFSMVSQLGFLPKDEYSAVEITCDISSAIYAEYTTIANSDAHYLADIGKRWFEAECRTPCFEELKEALARGAVECRGLP